MAALHVACDRRELGYTRPVCADCDMDWPCPDVAAQRAHDAGDHDSCGIECPFVDAPYSRTAP